MAILYYPIFMMCLFGPFIIMFPVDVLHLKKVHQASGCKKSFQYKPSSLVVYVQLAWVLLLYGVKISSFNQAFSISSSMDEISSPFLFLLMGGLLTAVDFTRAIGEYFGLPSI